MVKSECDTKSGVLYVVATPIGNLEDITLRALRILKEAHLIAAEDTRRTRQLLQSYGIQTPLTSLYDQNERRKSGFLVARMLEGQDVAYVSDAGTPGISDPGFMLIRKAIEQGVRIVPVPGVSAVVAALSVSGLPMDRFVFHGFLPPKVGKRRSFLQALADEEKTVVFYESPKRLLACLNDMEAVFGDRNIVVLRELTKVFEEIIRGRITNVVAAFQGRDIKGEVTLVVAGSDRIGPDCSDEDIRKRLEELGQDTKRSRRDIITEVAEVFNVSRKRVYRLMHIVFS